MEKNNVNNFIKRIFKKENKLFLIMIISIIVIVIIAVSNTSLFKSNGKNSEYSLTNFDYIDKYKTALEKDLTDIIESINGAGNAKVMITMESGAEIVYAVQSDWEEKSDLDNSTVGGVASETYNEKNEYIIINNKENGENGLAERIIQPKIRGVAIVCEGGDSAFVQEQVLNTAKAVLNINASKISIAKMNSKKK